MGRSAQQTRNLTDQQLAQQNQLISQSNQQGQRDRSAMMPTITSLLNSHGSRRRSRAASDAASKPLAGSATTHGRRTAGN